MTAPQPLTQTDLDNINKAIEDSDAAARLIAQSEQAGIDVSSFKESNIAAKNQLLRIKQSFFPGS